MLTASALTAFVFWLCAATVLYAYVGYPILIAVLARAFGRRPEPATVADDELPTVSLLVVAHNEEEVIEERVRNALATDYPSDRLEIVFASDGSTDATNEIVRRYATRGVRLLAFPRRRGKATTLNAAVASLTGEVILLSDANTHMDPQAARLLARWFRDPDVGAVCGRLVLTDPLAGGNVDGAYWKYETFLKRRESRLGALLGSNGAIYALRRSVFDPLPDNTIVDDFVIPLRAALQTGCRIVYDAAAVAREETPPRIGDEFRRRSRIGAGGFQSLGLLWPLLDPRRGWLAFTFLSHKVLRWVGPFLLAGALVGSALLSSHPFYRGCLLAQLIFYTLAAGGVLLPSRPAPLKVVRLATMFTGMNLALFVGFVRWARGRQAAAWHRTVRTVGVQGGA
jgi:cellulose synthase/poly-beta-1,6-N-acetylglucosamine synthase-like glycosyltransferase